MYLSHYFWIYFILICVRVCLCFLVESQQKPNKGVNSLELEFQLTVSHPAWVLGAELLSSVHSFQLTSLSSYLLRFNTNHICTESYLQSNGSDEKKSSAL